jgi:ABC-type bacteriocin/lantibiotic exporter with double-glycine peptidase domain
LLVDAVPFVHQRSESDCGAAALAMMLSYWGAPLTIDQILAVHPTSRDRGIKAGQLRDLARSKGLQAFVIKGQVTDLLVELQRRRPVLVGLAKPYGDKALTHYEVVVGLHRERRLILTLDPAHGWRQNTIEGFAREWVPTEQVSIVMFREAPKAAAAPPVAPAAANR